MAALHNGAVFEIPEKAFEQSRSAATANGSAELAAKFA
jgi:hypothetical protein